MLKLGWLLYFFPLCSFCSFSLNIVLSQFYCFPPVVIHTTKQGMGKHFWRQASKRQEVWKQRQRFDFKFLTPISTGDIGLGGEWCRGGLTILFVKLLPLNPTAGFRVGCVWEEVCVSVVWHHEVSPLLHSSLQPHPWGTAVLGHFS